MSRRSKRSKRSERSERGDRAQASSVFQSRNLIIGAGGVVILAIIVAVVVWAIGRSAADTTGGGESGVEDMSYHGIQGGITPEGLPYLGSADAPVVLTEFTDFACSHCQMYNLQTEDGILQDYVATGQVQYVLHYYSNGSPVSLQATDAAMCAADQGAYFQFQRAFFEGPVTTREGFITLAQELGLDTEVFTTCWDASEHRNELLNHIQAARKMGVTATPTFKVNDQFVIGHRPDLIRQTIEVELAQ